MSAKTSEPKVKPDRFYLIVTHRRTDKGDTVHSSVMAESEESAADQIGYRRRNYHAPEFTTVAAEGLTREEAHKMSTPGINLESLALAEHLGRIQDATEARQSAHAKAIAAKKAEAA